MSDLIKYPFDIEYQKRVLAVILRDRDFTLKHYSFLHPNYFDNEAFGDICHIVFKFAEKYGSLPSKETIKHKVKDYSNFKIISRLLDLVYEMDLSDAEDVEHELEDFVQQQQWRLTYPLVDNYVKEKQFDKARELFDKNMRLEERLHHEKNEIFYFEHIEQSLERLEPDAVLEKKIATLIDPIDRSLRGGPNRGELHMLFAPKKTGKSIFLCNIAYAGLIQEYNVLYITAELGEDQVEERIHSRITGIPDYKLTADKTKTLGRLKRLRELGGRLVIKKYPSRRATVKTIENYVDYLWKVKNFPVDLLIVDYLDLICSGEKHDMRWQDQGPVAEDLRGLAGEMNAVCWSVTQASPASESKDFLQGNDMKGDSVKADTVDSMWSLLQKPEDAEADPPRAILTNQYVRNGVDMYKQYPMKFDKAKMLLTELKQ